MFVSRSLPFDPQAAAIGIGRTVGTIRTAGAELVIDRVGRKGRAVAVYPVYLVCGAEGEKRATSGTGETG